MADVHAYLYAKPSTCFAFTTEVQSSGLILLVSSFSLNYKNNKNTTRKKDQYFSMGRLILLKVKSKGLTQFESDFIAAWESGNRV